MADIRVSIDRGGTFCDVIAHVEGHDPLIFKLLSEDPANYRDAPTEAIRRVLEIVEGKVIPIGEKLDGTRIGKQVRPISNEAKPLSYHPDSRLQSRDHCCNQRSSRAQGREVRLRNDKRYESGSYVPRLYFST